MCCLPVWLTMGPMGVCTPWAGKKAGAAAVAGCRAGLRARLLLCLKMIGSFEDPIAAADAAADAIGHGRLGRLGRGRQRRRRRCRRRRQWRLCSARGKFPPLSSAAATAAAVRRRRRRSSVAPPRLSIRPMSKTFRVQWPFMPLHAERTNEVEWSERVSRRMQPTNNVPAERDTFYGPLSPLVFSSSHPRRPLFGLEPSLVRAEVVMLSACYVAKRQEKRFPIRSQISYGPGASWYTYDAPAKQSTD